mmetsp:Transcript_4395/g.7382  ORF Transcript_4395/g.7382 Transcript_4395/m.7382 type:complete len:404 (-) Transcript_4395:328-1539(-)
MLLHHHHWISPRILNCQISSINDQWQEDVYFVIMKVSLIKHRLDPASSLNAGLTGGESTQPEEALAPGPEAGPGDGHHLGLLQHPAEELPRRLPLEVPEHVGRVLAAVGLAPHVLHQLLQDLGVLQVVVHQRVDLLKALRVQRGQAAALNDVRGAVEPRGHHAVEVVAHRGAVGVLQLVRHHGPAQAHPGEPRVLGEGIHLDGDLAGALDLVDALGHAGRADEGRVRRVEHQDGPLVLGVPHQLLELRLGGHGASGVVGRAEVDHVGALQRAQVGEEVVARVAGHVHEVAELRGLRVDRARLAHDDAGVHVHRVGGVLHSRLDLRTKHDLEAGNIALGTIRYKHLFRLDQAVVQVLGDLFTKRTHALLCTVATVPLLGTQLGGRSNQAAENVLRDGLCCIANT